MKNFRDLEIQKINNMNLEKIIEYANNNTDLLENNFDKVNHDKCPYCGQDKRDIVFEIYKYADLLDKLQNDITANSDDELNLLAIFKKLYIKLL